MNEVYDTQYDAYYAFQLQVAGDPLQVGERVQVRQWGGDFEFGVVTAVHEVVKNDEPGISWTTDSGVDHWAYLRQVCFRSH